jgi:hypothetical protein
VLLERNDPVFLLARTPPPDPTPTGRNAGPWWRYGALREGHRDDRGALVALGGGVWWRYGALRGDSRPARRACKPGVWCLRPSASPRARVWRGFLKRAGPPVCLRFKRCGPSPADARTAYPGSPSP